jgi:hypothetical protein
VIAADAGAPKALRSAIFTDLWRIRPTGEVLGMLGACGPGGGDRDFAAYIWPVTTPRTQGRRTISDLNAWQCASLESEAIPEPVILGIPARLILLGASLR